MKITHYYQGVKFGMFEPSLEMIMWVADGYSIGGFRGEYNFVVDTVRDLMLAGF